MSAKRPTEKGLEAHKEKSAMSGDYGVEAQYDRLMIVSKALDDGTETSDVYALTSATFEALAGTEFEPAAGPTIEAGTLGNGLRVIQVLKSEVRSYDGGKSPYSSLPVFSVVSNLYPNHVTGDGRIYLWGNQDPMNSVCFLGPLSGRNMSYSNNESVLPPRPMCIYLPYVPPRHHFEAMKYSDQTADEDNCL
jgi:hypothetical protein